MNTYVIATAIWVTLSVLLGAGTNRTIRELWACLYAMKIDIAKAEHRNLLMLPHIHKGEVTVEDPDVDKISARISLLLIRLSASLLAFIVNSIVYLGILIEF